MKIRTQLLVFILSVVLVGLASVITMSYNLSRKTVISEIYKQAESVKFRYRDYIDGYFKAAENVATGMAISVMTDDDISEPRIHKLLMESVKWNPEIYGMTIFLEPSSEERGKKLFAPYYFRDGKLMKYVPAEGTFKFWEQGWYSKPKEMGAPVWTEPYLDLGTKTIMTTFSVPIYRNKTFIGLATVDISLDALSRKINSIKIGEMGYAFLVSRDGTFLTHPDPGKYVLKEKIESVASQSQDQGFKELSRMMIEGKSGATSVVDPFKKKSSWVTYATVPASGYSLAIFIPEDELLSSADLLRDKILAVSVGVVILLVIIIVFVSSRITRPIADLSASAKEIAEGNLEASIRGSKSKSEIGGLTRDLTKMVGALKSSLESVREEKDKFQRVFSTMSDGVLTTTPAWEVMSCNPAACEMIGISKGDDLVGKMADKFQQSLQMKDVVDATKQEKRIELVSSEEKKRILSAVINTIHDNNNRVVEYVWTIRDITG
ncbi:MAG: cache domain-containing protein [Pseudomonadota bacterium]